MTVAMFVGMFALGMPARMLWDALGWTVLDATVPRTLLMAAYMTIGMSVWMLIRGCSWPAIGQMGLAMFIPFVMMYPFYWAGWVNTTAVMVVGHVLMVPAMIVAMLLRKDEYTRSHRAHREPAPQLAA
jgi:flagellar biosynthetic protein FliP